MIKEKIITGSDLRKFTMELLSSRKLYPPLSDYLLRLWSVTERHKQTTDFSFGTIACIISEAFEASPKEVDWAELLKEPKIQEYQNVPNTPEYFAEMRTYKVFENILRNQIVDLKLGTRFYPTYTSDWENTTTETYLERGTSRLEEQTDPDDDVTWSDFKSILRWGRYTD